MGGAKEGGQWDMGTETGVDPRGNEGGMFMAGGRKRMGGGIEAKRNRKHFANFCSRKSAKREEPMQRGLELRVEGTGSREFGPPICAPSPLLMHVQIFVCRQ